MTRVRPATEEDLAAVNRLYNAELATTTVTWRDDPMSMAECRAWFADRQARGHPVLVAERAHHVGAAPGAAGSVEVGRDPSDRTVVAFAAWKEFRGVGLSGYRHTVEHTIHVDEDHRGVGVGGALLAALIDEARRRGDIHVMVGAVDAANTASLAFHGSMGFTEVARMPEVGRKFDRWLDLVLVQRIIT